MSLIVETGAGLPDAESYISVVDSLTYHNARGNNTWATITTAQQEQALRRATDYMMEAYRSKWKGRRVLTTQALDWPRVGVVLDDFNGSQGQSGFGYYGVIQVDYTTVPSQIARACAELALRAAGGDLSPDIERETIKEGVGAIQVEYRPGSPQYVRYRAIDLLLAPYCVPASLKLVRG